MPHYWRGYRKWVDNDWLGLHRDSSRDAAARDELADEFDALPERSEEEYELARQAAEEKVEFYVDAGKKGVVALLLLIFIPPVGVILGLIWGLKFGRRFFHFILEPKLRDRFMNEEVGQRVRHSIDSDRRDLEGEHSRSLENLSASIAHEIRNPITAAKSLVQQMREDSHAAENPEYARVALAELERVERSISHLLRFARDEDLRLVEVQMADVLASALETFRDRAARAGVEIQSEFDCRGGLRGDPEKLRRAVINLVTNAFDALEEAAGERPRIDVSMGENLAGTEVWVRVSDNGPGMDQETRERVFNPFVTTKSGGTGLGLAITKKIVDSHDGAIEIASEEGRGTEFILTLPKKQSAAGGRP